MDKLQIDLKRLKELDEINTLNVMAQLEFLLMQIESLTDENGNKVSGLSRFIANEENS